jgi:succinate dehydrogenase hydrophobic anchor subunit
LVLLLWGPIYVACGFTLYLNRRTALEAWDIELVFRQLRQRLTGVAYAVLLSVALLFMPVADNAMAASEAAPVATDPNGPDAPRLLKQPLTSEQSQESITQLLDQPPFEHRETVTRWRFGEASEEPSAEDAKSLDEWMKKLADLAQLWKSVDGVALFFEVLLWTILFSLLAWLLWRYRDWLNAFAGRLRMPQVRRYQAPEQLFGLEVAPQSLPNDIAGEVERLWDEQPRAALSLLYRALLSRLLHEQQLALKSSDTEGEVLQQVHALQQAELSQFSQTLTRHWQNLAYGHQQPPAALKDELCTGWRQLFERGAQA